VTETSCEMPAKSGLGSELWESASLGLTFINRRVPFARFLRLGGGLIACRFLPFKRAGFVCGRKSREDGIVIGRPFLNSCSDARASAPLTSALDHRLTRSGCQVYAEKRVATGCRVYDRFEGSMLGPGTLGRMHRAMMGAEERRCPGT
jgi:hypothetical protein